MNRVRAAVVAVLVAVVTLGFLPGAEAVPARYAGYFSTFHNGPRNIAWAGTTWIPQGLARFTDNTLVVSYYDANGRANSRVALIDRRSGITTRWYDLGFRGHVGGVAVTKSYLWVLDAGYLHQYERHELNKFTRSRLTQVRRVKAPGSAYASAQGETLWIGRFSTSRPGKMFSYRVNRNGSLTALAHLATPPLIQGVVVTGNRIVWSQAHGVKYDSKLIVWPRSRKFTGSLAGGAVIRAPRLVEGLTVAHGELQVLYESGSALFKKLPYRVSSIHHASIGAVSAKVR